ncbi:MAG: hypothetical protein ABIO92_09040 [Chloroflexia bacterium]
MQITREALYRRQEGIPPDLRLISASGIEGIIVGDEEAGVPI